MGEEALHLYRAVQIDMGNQPQRRRPVIARGHHLDQIAYAVTEPAALEQGVRDGAGIGFMMTMRAEGDPNLVEVLPPRPEWESALRIVTHVDLHRTRKVQAFLTHLKDSAKDWTFCT